METVQKSIDIKVPVKVAYNQGTQFEDFRRFLEGIAHVKQQDHARLHWVANIGGKKLEGDAEITEQIPERRIAWCSQGDAVHSGMVFFDPIDRNNTRISLRIDYEPQGVTQEPGDQLGLVCRRVEGDLERFKDFIESRGRETGRLVRQGSDGKFKQEGASRL